MNGRKIFRSLIGMPLRVKLILFSALQIFVPVIFVGVISYNTATHILTEKVGDLSITALEQAARSIELFTNELEDLATFIVSDDSVQKLLKKSDESDKQGAALVDSTYNTLFNLTNSKPHISFISIYKELNGNNFFAGPPVTVGSRTIPEQQWYQKTLSLEGRMLWVDTYKNTFFNNLDPYIITLSCTINDIYRISSRLGVLAINIKEDSLYKFYGDDVQKLNREVFIVNRDGRIISHRLKNLLLTQVDEGLVSKGLLERSSGVITYKAGNKDQMVTFYRIPKLDWILVSMVSMDELLKENRIIGVLTFNVVVISVIITFFLSVFLASTISKPVRKLLGQMKEVSEGNFDIQADYNYGDEVSQLGKGFNSMVKRIDQLVSQVYLEQRLQREMELKALQAQINPHFLYNTLDSINWMAQEINARDISTMVRALARLFRISISKGKDIISVGDEIEHVKNYLIIQNIRYQDVLNTEISVSGDILDFKVPKLILQPLVENAIYHGIKKKNGKGIICITGKLEENKIIFKVIDNGAGMDKEHIERLNASLMGLKGEESSGYGVRNVHERIILRFGKEYGLYYTANEYGGITVEVRLPAIKVLEE